MLLGLCVLAGVSACKEPHPEVSINTYVGDSYARRDPVLQAEATWKVLQTAVPELWGARERAHADGRGAVLPDTVHPPARNSELEDLIAAIRKGPIDEVAGPARRIAAASPELWPEIEAALLAERKSPKGDYRSVLAAIGGDVPNRYGHFARAWKKAHGYDVKLSVDWFEDLLALPRSKISPVLLKVYRDCILQSALLRAAGRIGRAPQWTTRVVSTLLDAAYLHQGTFRDEVGRAIEAVGDEAIPTLLVESVSPEGRADDPDVKRAEYARYNLDRMDRLHPARVVEAVRDNPRLLAAVLRAYGKARMGEAADVLLDYVDDRTVAVRTAAREAFTAYVIGPAPKAKSRQVRLLGGELGRARAYLTYRQRATTAIRDRLAAQAPLLLEPECELTREDGTTDPECERAPQRHTESYFDWLDLQRTIRQQTRVDTALAQSDPAVAVRMLDELLAEDPHPVKADAIARFFAAQGEQAAASGDSARAGQLLRKASMLLRPTDSATAEALHTTAVRAEAEHPEVSAQGRRMLLASAGITATDEPAAEDPSPGRLDWRRLGTDSGWLGLAFFGLGFVTQVVRRRVRRSIRDDRDSGPGPVP